MPSIAGVPMPSAPTPDTRRLEHRLECLEAFTHSLIHDLVEIYEIARSAREDAEAAIGAVKRVENRISELDGQVLSNKTDDRFAALNALAEQVALDVKAVESQRATLERALGLAERAGRTTRVAPPSAARTWVAAALASPSGALYTFSMPWRRWPSAVRTLLGRRRSSIWLRCRVVAIGRLRALVLLGAALTCLVSDADRRSTQSIGAGFSGLESRSLGPPVTMLISTGTSTAESRISTARSATSTVTSMPAVRTSSARAAVGNELDQRVAGRPRYLGTVAIDSNPSVATVFIDRHQVGTTPFRASLPAGSHAIWIQREGYQRWTAGVLVPEHKLTPISVTLRPIRSR